MKRMIIALGLALAGVAVTVGVGTPANADTQPGPPWVHWKDLPDPAACNSAGVYFQQQGTIAYYLCDEVVPPSADAAGDTQLWVIF